MAVRARHLLLAAITAIAVSLLAPLPAHAAAYTVTVHVTSAAGTPVTSGISVQVWGGGESDTATGGANGDYTVTRELPGPIDISIDETDAQGIHQAKYLAEQPVTAGAPNTVDVALEDFTGIVVVAKDATSGAVLPNIGFGAEPSVPPTGPGGGYGGAQGTNANGRVALQEAPGDTYAVCGYDDDYNSDHTPVYRYQDTCWTVDGRYAATPSTADRVDLTTASRREITVPMPREGLSQDPEWAFLYGTPAVGQVLRVDTGTWNPADTAFTYDWIVYDPALGREVTIGTAATLTVPSSAQGKEIGVYVTGTKAGYVAHTTVDRHGVVGRATPTLSSPVTITGTATPGSTLHASHGTVSDGSTPSYTWLVGGKIVEWYSGPDLTLTDAMIGKRVSVRVSTWGDSSTNDLRAFASGPVVQGVLTAPTPTISGTKAVGYTLTANPGTWGPAPVALAYQWFRSGATISGATASTYKLTSTDVGKTITVRVTGSKSGYMTVAKTSAATAAVLNVFTTAPAPTITGTKKVGYTLTANPGTWSPTPSSYTYQWYRVVPSTGATSAISGATLKTYKLTSFDKGRYVYVRVTGHRSGYLSTGRNSARTVAIS